MIIESGGIRRVSAAWVLVAFALLPQPGMAQRTVEISDRPSCRRCEIQRIPLPALGDEAGEGIIESELSRVVQDSRGRLYLAGPYATRILMFDTQGRFLRTLGRPGHGPGEFAGIGSVRIGPADSLFVFDNPQSRLSVLAPDGEFVRSLSLPIAPAVTNFVAPDGRFIIGRTYGIRELGPHPLHLFDRQGTRLRSFGNLSADSRPSEPVLLGRTLAPGRGSTIWSGHSAEYVIDRLDLRDGSADLIVRRQARWFPPRPSLPRSDGRPEPGVIGVQEDESGRLWVLLSIPDAEWRKAYRAAPPGEPHGTITDFQGFHDTRIEVLDLDRGALIASLNIPEFVEGFSGPGEIGAVLISDGVPRFHRWRLTLSVPD